MNLLQISILFVLCSTLTMGLLVFLTQIHRRTNQSYLILSLVLTGWLLALGIASMVETDDLVMFWIRQTSAISALIPMAMYFLRMAITNPNAPFWPARARHLIRWLVPYSFVFYVCQSPYFILSVEIPDLKSHIPIPLYGPGFSLFSIYLLCAWAVLVWCFFSDLRQTKGVQKTELLFVLLGCICGLFIGINIVILPNILGLIEFSQLLPLSVIILHAFIAYGVATRSMLDIPNVVRRLIANLILGAYLAALYFSTWGVFEWAFSFAPHIEWPLSHFLATMAVVFAMSPARGWMQKLTNRLFIKSPPIDVGATIQEANHILNAISTVDELFQQFSALVHSKIQNEHLRILLIDDHRFGSHFKSSPGLDVLEYPVNHPLPAALEQNDGLLVYEMIPRLRPSEALIQAEQEMKQHDLATAVAIRTKGKTMGLMLLGPRASARIYGTIEAELLTGLCNQLAISLENAKLYTEVQNSRIYNDILLDRLVSGVIAVNAAHVITVFNREAQRITGMNPDKVMQAGIEVLPAVLREALRRTFEQGGGRDVDVTLYANGREIPIRYGCTPFYSHTGKVLGALLVFTDQTEMKKLEQQIRRTDRLASLGTLAAGMAHEIKNPLVAMKTFAQLLPERYEDPDFRKTFSSLLGDEVSRIDRIVNQLLRFARPAKPSLSPVKLHAVVDHTLGLLKQQLRQRNIELNRNYNTENDMIQGDNDMLTQALLNFFLNALDAMEEGGALSLKTEIIQQPTNQFDLWGQPVTTPRLSLAIMDNGRGISREDIAHVFDPFYTTKATGTGLGLSVAHGIIIEHRGVIDLESEPGVGTTFYLTFPLLDAGVLA